MLLFLFKIIFLYKSLHSAIDCKHFWNRDSDLVSSGKVVGVDVGMSPYGNEGTYICTLDLKEEDVKLGKFLYIGEVGDSSYLEIKRGPLGFSKAFPILHGLYPHSKEPARYLRFLPFFFPVREIFQADGIHEIWIHYKDILPQQTGIRSGVPSIESLDGVIRRALINGPAFSFHFVQSIVYLIFCIGSIFWIGVPFKKRISFSFFWLTSSLIIVSITGIPRYFFTENPTASLRFNDTANMIGFCIYLLPLSFFLQFENKNDWKSKVLLVVGIVILSIGFLSQISLYSSGYLPIYFGTLFLTACICPTYIGFQILKRKIFLSFSPMSWNGIGYALIFMGFCMGWDCIGNVLLFGMRFPFSVHYFFFTTASALLVYFQLSLDGNESFFIKKLAATKQFVLESLVSMDDSTNSLNKLSSEFAVLTNAKRVSILEISSGQGKFLGTFGNFKFSDNSNFAVLSNAAKSAIDTKSIIFGNEQPRLFTTYSDKDSEYCLIPLEQNNKIIALICLTEFIDGRMASFLKNRLTYFQSEASFLTSLFLTEKESRSRGKLLEIARLRVHPVQEKSERHFLESFSLSEKMNRPAILLGDLASSVRLHSLYGGQVIGDLIDEYLEVLWNEFKHNAFITSRRDGDFISFIFPNLSTDIDESSAARRACEVSNHIMRSNDLISSILKKFKVTVPFNFRMVLSQGETVISEKGKGLKSLSLLSSENIDLSTRVLATVPVAGELVLIGNIANSMKDFAEVIQLNPQRFKGFSVSPDLYTVVFKQKEEAA